MPERELRENVTELARVLGWECFWTWSSLNSPAGWPDLFLLHRGDGERGRAIAIELKREGGRVTPAQARTLALLSIAGIPAYVSRPRDWLDGTIERILKGGPA